MTYTVSSGTLNSSIPYHSSHCKADCHVEAYVAWKDYENQDSRPSILQQLTDERARQIQQNRQYLGAVVDVLKYTALHRLALRGHDEGAESLNAGNFLDILKLLGKYDDNVGKKLTDLPGNARYTSSDVQNEILGIMAKMVKTDIAGEVKESGEFSVMADETKDVRKIELMSIVLRYFLRGTVYESFVGFVPANVLTADGLSSELTSELQVMGLDYRNKLIGQGYDGASVMSGKHKGVAVLIQAEAPLAMYIHCHAHRLNLALVDCFKAVDVAAEFFVVVEKLYVYVSGSSVHARWLEMQKTVYPMQKARELQKLSDTRWACRYSACKAIRDTLQAIFLLLDEMSTSKNAQRAVEARSLISAIDANFVITLELLCDILGRTQSLSSMLQSATADLARAVDLIDIAVQDLVKDRLTDEHFDKVWTAAEKLCTLSGLDCVHSPDDASSTQGSKSTRVRRLPARLQDSVVLETVGDRVTVDSKTSYKDHVYLPIMDTMQGELSRRFDTAQCGIMRGIQALNPSSEYFADFGQIKPFAEAYKANLEDLQHELYQAKRLVERMGESGTDSTTLHCKPTTLIGFVACLARYGEAFHELCRLGRIAIALPVSTASCERSFSALRHIKTWVRNSTSNTRLANLSLLATERERTLSLSCEKVVDAFAHAHKNRRIALI